MWFLGLGLVLMLLKWQGWTAVAHWPWWGVLSPLGLAVLWWAWADASGYTKRRAVENERSRVLARVNRQREAMGLKAKRK